MSIKEIFFKYSILVSLSLFLFLMVINHKCSLVTKKRQSDQFLHLRTIYKDIFPDPDDENIFMLETSGNTELPSRVLCSLESYCRANGKASIWLLVTAHRLSASTKSELRRLHTSYQNLMVAHLDIEVVLSGTPLIDIIHDEKFYESEFWVVNLSDLARIAIVYTSGGLYTDSDILALRPVENLKNVLAIQLSLWGTFGPHAYTPLLNILCPNFSKAGQNAKSLNELRNIPVAEEWNAESLAQFDKPEVIFECTGVSVLETASFYPLYYKELKQLFGYPNDAVNIVELLMRSYGFHFNNKVTKDVMSVRNSTIFAIARTACPSTVERFGNIF